jgi:glycosyltransferase involved in cell wall biosynthesis
MNILYDGQIFQMQRAGGINRYFAEIISGLPADYYPIITGVRELGRNAPQNPHLILPHFCHFRPRRLRHFLHEKWWKPRLLNGIDLFHPTYYDLTEGYSLEDFKGPMVITVYDFVYAIYPDLAVGSEYVIRCQTQAILKADFVICISQATENDLLERFPGKRGKTRVIHLGSSFAIQPPMNDRSIFETPSFL